MSSALYNKEWDKLIGDLHEVKLNYEPSPDAPPITDARLAIDSLSSLFIRYLQVP